MGGSSSNGGGGVESPNSLISNSLLKYQDLLCEGPIKGFANMGGAFGFDPLCATYFNDVQFRNADGSYNFNVSGQGFQFAYTLGFSGQVPMSGFEKVITNIPLPPNTKVTNPPFNGGLPTKVIVNFNTNQYPDANSIIVNWRIPQMYGISDNGNINGHQISVQTEIALNGGAYTVLDNDTFNGKNTTPYYRTYPYSLPITDPPQSYYAWSLRFTKSSQDVQSSKIAEDIYVDSVSVVSTSQFSYPNSVMVGTYLDALQFGTVPTRSYLIDGLLTAAPSGYTPPQPTAFTQFTRQFFIDSGDLNIGEVDVGNPAVFNGMYVGMSVSGTALAPNTTITFINAPGSYIHISQPAIATNHNCTLTFTIPNVPSWAPAVYPDVWDGTLATGVWTSNPAWVFYDLLTNSRYGLGQYINTEQVDIWTLYQISQFCDEMVDNGQGIGVLEPQFTCNAFISSPQDAYSMLLNLSSVFRGMLYYANGTIQANITDNKTPVFNYTNANVVNGAFSYSSTARSARHNAVQVKYTDPTNLYRDNYILVEDNQGIQQYGYNKKDIAAFACTSQGQAQRVANWILATERLRTETAQFQVGLDGLYIRPGDVFNLYDNYRMNKSQGGRVVSFDSGLGLVTLDRPVALDSGCIYQLNCLIPQFNFDNVSDITGSSQIPEIRNPQLTLFTVLNADVSGLSTLQVAGSFSGMSNNTVWILSATGVYTANYVPTIFEQAPQYECLTVGMSSPGVMDILALKYNTGINYTVNTGFSIIMNPPNPGDKAAPLPVSNFTGQLITGQLSDSSFYQYLNLTWTASQSYNIGGYLISGDPYTAGVYSLLGATVGTGFQYFADATGTVTFQCIAEGNGGGMSAPQSFNYTFPAPPVVDPAQIRFWLLPDGFGNLEQIAAFYNRPAPSVTSSRIFYATGVGAPFKEVLDQSFYPVLGVSQSGLSTTGTTAYFSSNSYDIPNTFISQGAIQQAQNTLLYLVDNELMSVGAISGLGGTNYAFSMSRGVLGTFPAVHSGNISGWMFLSADINSFSDQSIATVFNATGYSTGTATRYFQVENNTALLQGAITPASPGLAYLLPNPTPDAPTSLTATIPGGPIVHLTWVAPNNTDILQYHVFQATSPFSTFNLIASTTQTYYDDTSVLVGNTYQYYVKTEATDELQSTQSNTVTAIPFGFVPTGVSTTPPANAAAASLSSSGNYLSQDGSLLAYLTFNVSGAASGAAYTNVTYVQVGHPLVGATVAGQATGTTVQSVTIFDLSPNVGYNIGTQSVSAFGLFSQSPTLAFNSPITAPAFNNVTSSPGGPPATPTNLTISGGLGNTANFVSVSWNANNEANLEEYGVYRAGSTNPGFSPSLPSNPIAFSASNRYVDATVTGGATYYYWISAYNRSNQQSSVSSSVGPLTVQGAPAAAGVPSCTGTGFYYGIDGTVYNSLMFSVPQLPAYAFGQQLLYGLTNNTAQMTVGGDVENGSGPTGVTLNDLTPTINTTNAGYYVALKPYSQHGVPGTITFANGGNPYPTPGRTTAVNPPTAVQIGPALYGSPPAVPPKYGSLLGNPVGVLGAITGSWTASPDSDIAFYEWYVNEAPLPPSSSNPINYRQTVPASSLYTAVYDPGFAAAGVTMWIRAINKSRNTSTWTQANTNTLFLSSHYAGDLGVQNASDVNVQSFIIAQSQAIQIRSYNVQHQYVSATVRTPGGATVSSVSYAYNMTGMGFTVQPQVAIANLDGASHGVQYRYTASTWGQAVFSIYRFDGTADITDGEVFTFQAYFQQNY